MYQRLIHDKPCQYCGEEIELCWGKERNLQLQEQVRCFNCDFWIRRLEGIEKDPENFFTIDGNVYWNGGHGKTDALGYKGFGGNCFHIERFDGSQVTTDNLWHNGKVPELWRNKFPDNAKFIQIPIKEEE
jgi:hypothetical protein